MKYFDVIKHKKFLKIISTLCIDRFHCSVVLSLVFILELGYHLRTKYLLWRIHITIYASKKFIIYCNVSQRKDLVVTGFWVSSGSLLVHKQFCLYFSSLSYLVFPPPCGLKRNLMKPDLPLLSSAVSSGLSTLCVLQWLIIYETDNRGTRILHSIYVLGTFLSS